MSKEHIAKGKNLQEAIENGLEKIGLSESQVEIEIVRTETNGLLRIMGTKPAVVRIKEKSDRQAVETEDVLPGEQQERNLLTMEKEISFGQVWVKDGQIFLKETKDHYPTITVPKEVSFYKNGLLVKHTTALMEKDRIEVHLLKEAKDPFWKIDLDPLKVTALLTIEPGYRREYTLMDQEPSPHLELAVQVMEEVINPLQLDQIEQEMRRLGIELGIDHAAIQTAMEATEPGVYTIAKGRPPQHGTDGRLKRLVMTEWRDHTPATLPNGDIDVQSLLSISHVHKGQLLGRIYPPQPGQSGLAVTGKTVPPDVPQEKVVYVGSGTVLMDQGTKVVSIAPGRPMIEEKGRMVKVSVVPQYVHSNEIDESTGDITFFGDIEIKGNIQEKMTVETFEDMLIHGSVEMAKVSAGRNLVICKSVINSQVHAGKKSLILIEMLNILGRLAPELKGFTAAVEQVYQSPLFQTSELANTGLNTLIRILFEKKFKGVPPLIKEMEEVFTKAACLQMLNPEFKEIRSELVNGFLRPVPTQFKKPVDMKNLVDRISRLYEFHQSSGESYAHLMLPYAMNSNLYCNGDITIIGKGCMDSTLHSEGKISIQGVLRGGEAFAAKGFEVNEAGSKAGKTTYLKVPVDQTIKINQAFEGTIIQIGQHIHQFVLDAAQVTASVNDEGRMVLSTS